MSHNEDGIVLQVGNHTFYTTRTTLKLAGEGSFLHTLASLDERSLLPLRRSAEGHVLVDRCGEKFKSILESLRRGPEGASVFPFHRRVDLEAEARFYGFSGQALVNLIGPPQLILTSEDLQREDISDSAWMLRGEVDEDHQVLLWVPDISDFHVTLQVARKRSSVNSGFAKLEGWGLDIDTSLQLPALESQIIGSTRKPWSFSSGSPQFWHVHPTHIMATGAALPEHYLQTSAISETHMVFEVLPRRPTGLIMPKLIAYHEEENNLSAILSRKAGRPDELMQIWPEDPQYWTPRSGEGPGVTCAPLVQAAVAGVRNVGRNDESWVSSSIREWGVCFWDPAESSHSLAEACPPQVPYSRLDIQASAGTLAFLAEGCKKVARSYPLPKRSGHLRLWFTLRDVFVTEAQVRLTVHGHSDTFL
jgi:hypothetical protein